MKLYYANTSPYARKVPFGSGTGSFRDRVGLHPWSVLQAGRTSGMNQTEF